MGNAQSSDNPSAVAIDNPTNYPITATSSYTSSTTEVASSIRTSSTSSSVSTTPRKKSTLSTSGGYPIMPQQPIKKVNPVKKPQPFTGSFYNSQYAEPIPHAYVKKPNRSAGHVNFFEVAAATHQPTKSTTSSSNSSNSSSNKKSYPSTSNSSSQVKKLNSAVSSSSTNSSNASTTVEKQFNKLPQKEDTDYIYLDGRRYWKGHGSQVYILPCDDDENNRLMTIHYILKSVFNDNFISPIGALFESEKHTKVLDIGCGAGTWILEMATEFPNAAFYGIDNCPLFPTHIKPSNAHFMLQNVLKGLPYDDNSFDFVYMRSMITYFTPNELSYLLTEISRVMKPGGYFEVVDTPYTVRNAGPLSNKIVNTELKKLLQNNITNKTVNSPTFESYTNHPIFTFLMMAPQQPPASSFDRNFIDICQEHATLPIGNWGGGQIGELHGASFKSLLSSLQLKNKPTTTLDEKLDSLNLNNNQQQEIVITLPLPKYTVNTILEECNRYKSYLDWFACYARKPMNDDHLEQSTLDSIYEFVDGFVDV